jgi:hypothetical protein
MQLESVAPRDSMAASAQRMLSKGQRGGPRRCDCRAVASAFSPRVEGFEPPNGGTKTRCLTTWRHPIQLSCHGLVCNSVIAIAL